MEMCYGLRPITAGLDPLIGTGRETEDSIPTLAAILAASRSDSHPCRFPHSIPTLAAILVASRSPHPSTASQSSRRLQVPPILNPNP